MDLLTIPYYIFLGLCIKYVVSSSQNCPQGWIDSLEGCFFFHSSKLLTWRNSQLECEELGGFLVEPKSKEQQALLRSLAYLEQSLVGDRSWWIGATDQGHENRWIWQYSVEDVILSNWAPEYPEDNDPNDDCALMNTDLDYQWTDVNCDELLASPICQLEDSQTTSFISSSTVTTSFPGQYFIELRDGKISESTVEGNIYVINSNGLLGPVCDDFNWNDIAAEIVCRQLGFTFGGYATENSYFGNVPTKYAMDDVSCSGSEKHLQDCSYTTEENCNPKHGAGVVCYTKENPGEPPLSDYVELKGGVVTGGQVNGNVYGMNRNGYLGPVCDDEEWNDIAANIVCKQLGFNFGGHATYASYFGDVSTKYAMDEVHCFGSENRLQDCFYQTDEDCNPSEGAGVVCYTEDQSVTTTQPSIDYVELRGGDWSSGNVFAQNRAGYLGPVCDIGWNTISASVVCRQLGFDVGLNHTGSIFGSVPTHFAMVAVECEGTESHIQECEYDIDVDCQSLRGAGVTCTFE